MSDSEQLNERQSNGPVYLQICDHLRQELAEQRLQAGDFLPTDQSLSEQFGVSVGTVKKAMKLLEAERLIHRRQGCGTQIRGVGFGPQSAPSRGGKILVLMDGVRRSFFAEIYSGIQSELERDDLEPVLLETRNEPQREQTLLERHMHTATGVIIVPCGEEANATIYRDLFGRPCPVVFVDRQAKGLDHDAVVSDNERGGWLAVCHLLALGHRRIMILGGGRGSSVLARIDGARRAASEWGLDPDEVLVRLTGGSGFDGAYELVGGYLRAHPELTAAFCPRDDAAWGCIQRLHEIGVPVPERFSVIGYDDNEDICSRIRPRLTTVRQAKSQMGSTAARRLMWRLSHPGMPVQHEVISLPVELVVRESTTAATGDLLENLVVEVPDAMVRKGATP